MKQLKNLLNLPKKLSLQLPVLQTPEATCKAQRFVDRHILPKLSTIAASEWNLNLVGFPHVNTAGLVMYLLEAAIGKTIPSFPTFRQTSQMETLFLVWLLLNTDWEGHICGLSMHRVSLNL